MINNYKKSDKLSQKQDSRYYKTFFLLNSLYK